MRKVHKKINLSASIEQEKSFFFKIKINEYVYMLYEFMLISQN